MSFSNPIPQPIYTETDFSDPAYLVRYNITKSNVSDADDKLAKLCQALSSLLMSTHCIEGIAEAHSNLVVALLKNFNHEISFVCSNQHQQDLRSVYSQNAIHAAFELFVVCVCAWPSVWSPSDLIGLDYPTQSIYNIFNVHPTQNLMKMHSLSNTFVVCASGLITSLFMLLSLNADIPTSDLTQEILDITSHYTCVAFNAIVIICDLQRFYMLKAIPYHATRLLTLMYRLLPYEKVSALTHKLNSNTYSSGNLDRFLLQQDTPGEGAPKTPLDIVPSKKFML
jgi:hypothetical protein